VAKGKAFGGGMIAIWVFLAVMLSYAGANGRGGEGPKEPQLRAGYNFIRTPVASYARKVHEQDKASRREKYKQLGLPPDRSLE